MERVACRIAHDRLQPQRIAHGERRRVRRHGYRRDWWRRPCGRRRNRVIASSTEQGCQYEDAAYDGALKLGKRHETLLATESRYCLYLPATAPCVLAVCGVPERCLAGRNGAAVGRTGPPP